MIKCTCPLPDACNWCWPVTTISLKWRLRLSVGLQSGRDAKYPLRRALLQLLHSCATLEFHRHDYLPLTKLTRSHDWRTQAEFVWLTKWNPWTFGRADESCNLSTWTFVCLADYSVRFFSCQLANDRLAQPISTVTYWFAFVASLVINFVTHRIARQGKARQGNGRAWTVATAKMLLPKEHNGVVSTCFELSGNKFEFCALSLFEAYVFGSCWPRVDCKFNWARKWRVEETMTSENSSISFSSMLRCWCRQVRLDWNSVTTSRDETRWLRLLCSHVLIWANSLQAPGKPANRWLTSNSSDSEPNVFGEQDRNWTASLWSHSLVSLLIDFV